MLEGVTNISVLSGNIERLLPDLNLSLAPSWGQGHRGGAEMPGPSLPLGQRSKGKKRLEATADSPPPPAPHSPLCPTHAGALVSLSCSSSRRLWVLQNLSFLICKLGRMLILPSQALWVKRWFPGALYKEGTMEEEMVTLSPPRACGSAAPGLSPPAVPGHPSGCLPAQP